MRFQWSICIFTYKFNSYLYITFYSFRLNDFSFLMHFVVVLYPIWFLHMIVQCSHILHIYESDIAFVVSVFSIVFWDGFYFHKYYMYSSWCNGNTRRRKVLEAEIANVKSWHSLKWLQSSFVDLWFESIWSMSNMIPTRWLCM